VNPLAEWIETGMLILTGLGVCIVLMCYPFFRRKG
jgi:hypothetical protein